MYALNFSFSGFFILFKVRGRFVGAVLEFIIFFFSVELQMEIV